MGSDDNDDRRRQRADEDRRRQNAEDDERRRQNAEDDERRRQRAEEDRRRQDARDDDRHQQNEDDDRRRRADLDAERKRRFDDAMRAGDYEAALAILGERPATTRSATPSEPVHKLPLTARELLSEHIQALLVDLRSTDNFLPPELRADWARRVEGLDIEKPERGLAEIGAIRHECRTASTCYEPPITFISWRMAWTSYVARIDREMDCVAALFRHALLSSDDTAGRPTLSTRIRSLMSSYTKAFGPNRP